MGWLSRNVLYRDRDLGNVPVPRPLLVARSLAGRPTRPLLGLAEVGIVVAKHHRPVWQGGHMHDGRCWPLGCEVLRAQAAGRRVPIERMALLDYTISHNGRNQYGAGAQFNRTWNTATGANVQAPAGVFNVIGVSNNVNQGANQVYTDKSLTSASLGVSTNEFTTVGLSRVAGTSTYANYTAPTSFSAQATQVVTNTFTVSGAGGSAYGSGLFDSTTVAGSVMIVEDSFTLASLIAADTLTVNWTINN